MLILYLAMLETDEDKELFERLYLKYRQLMFCVANKILDNEEDSEDTVHQAFLNIIKHLDKFREVNNPDTKNLIMMTVKAKATGIHKKRKNTVFFEDIGSKIIDDTITEQTDFDALKDAIEELPDNYRDVIELKYYYICGNGEIAQLLSISEATVRKRLERARAKLDEILCGECK